MAEDNWVHRSAGMLCSSCLYYVPKRPAPGMMAIKQVGRCRRNAPTMKGWPVMFATDWCGEHKLDENKIIQDDEMLKRCMPGQEYALGAGERKL